MMMWPEWFEKIEPVILFGRAKDTLRKFERAIADSYMFVDVRVHPPDSSSYVIVELLLYDFPMSEGKESKYLRDEVRYSHVKTIVAELLSILKRENYILKDEKVESDGSIHLFYVKCVL